MSHPIQPVVLVNGIARFKRNEIVNHLLECCANRMHADMNSLAMGNFSKEDRNQFAQLIGYSVSGYGDLSYADRAIVNAADRAVEVVEGAKEVSVHLEHSADYWERIGVVGIDSGQLMLTDPCYIGSEWKTEERAKRRIAPMFVHDDGGKLYCAMHGGSPDPDAKPFRTFEEVIQSYNASPNQMIAAGTLIESNVTEAPSGEYSYQGCCEATLSEAQAGQLNYKLGHAGAGVVCSTGVGDGCYEVFVRYQDEGDWGTRVAEVKVVFLGEEEDDE